MPNQIFTTALPKILTKQIDFSELRVTLASSNDIDFETASTMTDIADVLIPSAIHATPLTLEDNELKPSNPILFIPIVGTVQTIGAVLSDPLDNLVAYVDFGNIREVTDGQFRLELPTSIYRFRSEVN